MILELKQIFEITGESQKIDYSLDLSDYELFSRYPFITPVVVRGEVSNKAGVVILTYTADFCLELCCDRCLEVFKRDFTIKNEEVLVTELNTDNDEYIVVEDMKLDMDELCISDILLSLPSKIVCNEDCKGLCPQCGTNLNQNECHCKKQEVDPRLSVLSELLK